MFIWLRAHQRLPLTKHTRMMRVLSAHNQTDLGIWGVGEGGLNGLL